MLLPRAVRRPALALTAAAATTLALAACGTQSGASQDPSLTMPSSVGLPPSSPATPAQTDTPAAPASSTATPTSPTSPASPASTSPTASLRPTRAASGRLLDFGGIHLLLPVEQSDLPGIPDGLRSALAAGLKKRWDKYGDAPACEKGPVYVVNKVDTGGWAAIDSWDDPGVTGPGCAGVGGGYTGFWALVNGTWQEVVATQQMPACATFHQYHFPVSVAGDKCAAPDGSEVSYSG